MIKILLVIFFDMFNIDILIKIHLIYFNNIICFLCNIFNYYKKIFHTHIYI